MATSDDGTGATGMERYYETINAGLCVAIEEHFDDPERQRELAALDAAYSTPKLPPIPGESCHRFHGKATTCSTRKLPLIP